MAEDVVVAAFTKALEQCAEFRGDGSPTAWLSIMVRRAIIDHWRRTRTERPLLDDAGEILAEVDAALARTSRQRDFDPAARAEDSEASRLYDECFRRFRQDHPQAAAVIAWVAEDGLTIEQLSRVLERSPAATRQYLSQCRKKARVYFADWYVAVAPVGARFEAQDHG